MADPPTAASIIRRLREIINDWNRRANAEQEWEWESSQPQSRGRRRQRPPARPTANLTILGDDKVVTMLNASGQDGHRCAGRFRFLVEGGEFALRVQTRLRKLRKGSLDYGANKSAAWFVAYVEYAISELDHNFGMYYKRFRIAVGGTTNNELKNKILAKEFLVPGLEVEPSFDVLQRTNYIDEYIKHEARQKPERLLDKWTKDLEDTRALQHMIGSKRCRHAVEEADMTRHLRDMADTSKVPSSNHWICYYGPEHTIAHFRKHGEDCLRNLDPGSLDRWRKGVREFLIKCNATVRHANAIASYEGLKQERERNILIYREIQFDHDSYRAILSEDRKQTKATAYSEVVLKTWYKP